MNKRIRKKRMKEQKRIEEIKQMEETKQKEVVSQKEVEVPKVVFGFTSEERSLLDRCTSKIENNKRKKESAKSRKEQSNKQRQMDHLTSKQRRTINNLRNEMMQYLLANKVSNSNNKKEEKRTKESLKKGRNSNQGSYGIHSQGYLEDVMGTAATLIKFCVEKYDIQQLRQIKSSMVTAYIEQGVFDKGWAYGTAGTYIGHIKKIGESCYKKMNNYKKLVTEPTMQMYKSTKPNGTELENRTRNRKKDGSTYTLREARIITRHLEKEFGPYGKALGNMLMEGGFRSEEIRKMKWKDIDADVKVVDLTRDNVTKNSRPRIVTSVSSDTINLLMNIKGYMGVKNDEERIFGRLFTSVKSVNNALERACRSGKVAYLGAHAFRSVSKEYQTKQLNGIRKEFTKDFGGKYGDKEYKKWLAKEILEHVGADPSLNKIGKDGLPRFTYEKLMKNMSIEKLEKMKISQNFGHNRLSVIRAYGQYISRAAKATMNKENIT